MCKNEIQPFPSSEMLTYLSYIRRSATIQPRTYWLFIPFYTIIKKARQKFNFGYRPEHLADIDTIEQKAWKKHQAHLNRLERFPLEKAEYYLKLKESHGVNSVSDLPPKKWTQRREGFSIRTNSKMEVSNGREEWKKEAV